MENIDLSNFLFFVNKREIIQIDLKNFFGIIYASFPYMIFLAYKITWLINSRSAATNR